MTFRCTSLVVLVLYLATCFPASAQEADTTELYSKTPLTVTEVGALREQIESNWNVGSNEKCDWKNAKPIELRVHLQPDGTVTKIDSLGLADGDECARVAYDSARRAVMISSPLKLPPDKTYATIRLRFHPEYFPQ